MEPTEDIIMSSVTDKPEKGSEELNVDLLKESKESETSNVCFQTMEESKTNQTQSMGSEKMEESKTNEAAVCPQMTEESKSNETTIYPQITEESKSNEVIECPERMEELETNKPTVCSQMIEESKSNETTVCPQLTEVSKANEVIECPQMMEEPHIDEATVCPRMTEESKSNEVTECPERIEELETNDPTVCPQMTEESKPNEVTECPERMEELETDNPTVCSQMTEESKSNETTVCPQITEKSEPNEVIECRQMMEEPQIDGATVCSQMMHKIDNNIVNIGSILLTACKETVQSQEVANSNEDEITCKKIRPTEVPEILPNFIENRSSSPKSNVSQNIADINAEILAQETMDHSNIEVNNNELTNELEISKTSANLESSSQILDENVCLKEKELAALLEINNSQEISNNTSIKLENNSIPNSSLKLLAEYNSDSEKEENENCDANSEDNDVMEIPPEATTDYRNIVVEIKSESESESSSSDDSDTEYLTKIRQEIESNIDLADEDDEDEDADDDAMSIGSKRRKQNQMRVKGELMLEDLPPIQDLHITVPEKECVELGRVHSIVDQLLLVNVLPNSLLLDLDTVLFLDKGQKVLGAVFDVLGQVADPMYCVRFNTHQEIEEKNINVDDIVYVAPKTEYTQFVILSNLMKSRGSDASWENDVEPPPRYLDYSDDEQEREARTRLRNKDRPNDHQDPIKRSRGVGGDESMAASSSTYSGVPKPRTTKFDGHYNRDRGNMSRQHHTPQYRQNYPTNSSSWHSNYQRLYPQQQNVMRQMPPAYSSNSLPPNYGMYHPYQNFVSHPPPPPPSSPQSPMYVLNPLAVVPPRMFTHLPPPKLSPHSPPPPPPGLD